MHLRIIPNKDGWIILQKKINKTQKIISPFTAETVFSWKLFPFTILSLNRDIYSNSLKLPFVEPFLVLYHFSFSSFFDESSVWREEDTLSSSISQQRTGAGCYRVWTTPPQAVGCRRWCLRSLLPCLFSHDLLNIQLPAPFSWEHRCLSLLMPYLKIRNRNTHPLPPQKTAKAVGLCSMVVQQIVMSSLTIEEAALTMFERPVVKAHIYDLTLFDTKQGKRFLVCPPGWRAATPVPHTTQAGFLQAVGVYLGTCC